MALNHGETMKDRESIIKEVEEVCCAEASKITYRKGWSKYKVDITPRDLRRKSRKQHYVLARHMVWVSLYYMRETEMTARQLAKHYGVDQSTVNNGIHNRIPGLVMTNHYMAEALASAIDELNGRGYNVVLGQRLTPLRRGKYGGRS